MALLSFGQENSSRFIAFLFSVQPCLIRPLQWLQPVKLAHELFVSLSVCLNIPQIALIRRRTVTISVFFIIDCCWCRWQTDEIQWGLHIQISVHSFLSLSIQWDIH